MCENCDDLALALDDLEVELADARHALETVRGFCAAVTVRSEGILEKRSGVPRGKWAFAKGAHEIAARVLECVKNA